MTAAWHRALACALADCHHSKSLSIAHSLFFQLITVGGSQIVIVTETAGCSVMGLIEFMETVATV